VFGLPRRPADHAAWATARLTRPCTGEDSPFHPFLSVCAAKRRTLCGLTPFPYGLVRTHHRSGQGVSLLFQRQPSPTPGLRPVTCPNGGGTFLMGWMPAGSRCQPTPIPRGSGSLYPIDMR